MQVTVFVDGMFALNQDTAAFREHLRDFIVQIKVRNILFYRGFHGLVTMSTMVIGYYTDCYDLFTVTVDLMTIPIESINHNPN